MIDNGSRHNVLMIVEINPLAVLVLDLAVWVLGGIAIGWLHAVMPVERLQAPGPFTRLRRAEAGGHIHRRWFRVHRWKDLVPDAGTWFGGLSKRRLPARLEGGWRRFAAESLRAERVHFSMIGLMLPLAVWNPPRWWVANLALSVVGNLPCIVIARHNRARVDALSARRAA
jgi:glycosyl-4,4'-diaponeurosporenoate acyltransferase